MFKAVSIKNRSFLVVGALVAGLAAPVSAALWQMPETRPDAAPFHSGDNLARYDAVSRIGAAQNVTDPYCDHRPLVLANLRETYGETLQSQVDRADSTLLEVWASGAAGTWTAIYTRADGVACVIGSGTGWSAQTAGHDRIRGLGLPS